ncbi:hypothetical protein TrRE_jg9555 [Triparma retinervis]|uniref:Uncharacterized protein n=1 Tax=Triparma retinervis TaxID=2557542 RepID=A0A9W7E2Y3_9STRA|nr:hypothetical protein TrRE_jg9555 [Triparma retinervis]
MFHSSLFSRMNNKRESPKGSGVPDASAYPLDIVDPSFPVEVKVSVKIIKILSIDTSANTFLCDFILTCKWEDNTFLPVASGEVSKSDVDMSLHFVPEFDVANLISHNEGNFSDPEFKFYRRKDSNTCRVAMKQRISGVFFEHFELAKFPFDVQSLSIKVRARQDIRHVQWALASQMKYPSVFSGKRFTLPEWDYLCPPGTPFVRVENVGSATSQKSPHAMFVFNQPVSRKIGYYLSNVIPLYFLIVAFGLVAFGNDVHDLANRFNALIALLLTSTAFKYIYKESLPRVHYLTRLDYYMYLEHLFIVAQGGMHAWAKISLEAGWRAVEDIRDIEIVQCVSLAALWIFFHFVLVNWAKGHRALLDVDAETLEKLLIEVEKEDRRLSKRRKRGMFWMCWTAGGKRGADRQGGGGGGKASGRGISSSSLGEVLDDFELGAFFEMEDSGEMADSERLADGEIVDMSEVQSK